MRSSRRFPREKSEEALQYNQRWKGYLSIALASLVNFSSVSGIKVKFSLKDERFVAIFGVVTFVASAVILILDRITFLHKKIDLKELYDGKLGMCKQSSCSFDLLISTCFHPCNFSKRATFSFSLCFGGL